MNRREFLQALGAFAGVSGIVAHRSTTSAIANAKPTRVPTQFNTASSFLKASDLVGLPIADWLVEENRKKGSLGWVIEPQRLAPGAVPSYPAPIEGFVDRVSYQRGDVLTLYVSTIARHFRADVYRLGYYQGVGARRIRSTLELVGKEQPLADPTPGVSMIECDWKPSAVLEVDEEWVPGTYVIKLVGGDRHSHYVPFTVRDDNSTAALVLQSGVATWQAYNLWGGYSLYGGGRSGALADRSRVVSFDRPYRNPDQNGSGDFLGDEYPLVYLAERLGLDVTYWTDIDLHERPELLANHRCLVSLGHDEYWSWQMRFNGVLDHLAKGLNVAFLGANAMYRQVRFEPSPLGANRRMVCYKDATADPIFKSAPQLATGDSWATDPVPYPESEVIGVMYQSYGASAPMIVANASSWVFDGTGVRHGEALSAAPGELEVVGSEFDGFEPALSGPKNVEILAHTPTTSVSGHRYSDASYVTYEGGGGVFATGTASWVTLLWDGDTRLEKALNFGISRVVAPLTQITLNVLRVFAKGPAGKTHPSVSNWHQFYSPHTPVVKSVDVP